jgi:signal transduction histidine kinase/sugar phosphate isomerase/epimerase
LTPNAKLIKLQQIQPTMTTKRYHLAAQTILWGAQAEKLDEAFETIASLGFEAVELSQSPYRLSGNAWTSDSDKLKAAAAQLDELLEKHGLKLLGLAGGSLPTRIKFSEHLRYDKPKYFYIDTWETHYTSLLETGHPLAFHPHVFKGYSYEKLERLLLANPTLSVIPDSAHFYLMQFDIISFLNKYKSRLASFHFKDWDNRHGWSRVMYARGFTELGKGTIESLAVVKQWLDENFSGFCVVEQDCTKIAPAESLAISRSYLTGNSTPYSTDKQSLSAKSQLESHNISYYLHSLILAGSQSLDSLYKAGLNAIQAVTQSTLSTLWEVNSLTDTLTRECTVSTSCAVAEILPHSVLLRCNNAIAGQAVSEQAPLLRSVSAIDAERIRPEMQDLIDRGNISHVLSIPIHNSYNPHVVDLVINAYFAAEPSIPWIALGYITDTLGLLATTKLNELHASILDFYSSYVPTCERLQEFLVLHRTEILMQIPAQEIRYYAFAAQAGAPTLMATWSHDSTCQLGTPESGNDSILPSNSVGELALSSKTVCNAMGNGDSTFDPDNPGKVPLLATPMFTAGLFGAPRGVLVCIGRQDGSDQPFSLHDEIAIDAIQAGLGAVIDRISDIERHADTMRVIRHEVKNPIGCVRNAVGQYCFEYDNHLKGVYERIDSFDRQLKRVKAPFRLTAMDLNIPFYPSKPLLEDTERWLQTLETIVDGRGFLTASGDIVLARQGVNLLRDVVAPAVSQMLKEIPIADADEKIEYVELTRVPTLFCDKNAMVMVVLNLIRNAVKYRKSDDRRFSLKFESRNTASGWEISVCDEGKGVDAGYEDLIFNKGVRAPSAKASSVDGDGFGLWLVRQILRKHGASIRLDSPRNPTRFTITLPRDLEMAHWITLKQQTTKPNS